MIYINILWSSMDRLKVTSQEWQVRGQEWKVKSNKSIRDESILSMQDNEKGNSEMPCVDWQVKSDETRVACHKWQVKIYKSSIEWYVKHEHFWGTSQVWQVKSNMSKEIRLTCQEWHDKNEMSFIIWKIDLPILVWRNISF